ncbi:PACT_coil_coil domain-containing protein [Caerostris extrusa]|uniref:PACT_coil_coil domain-containing protein n=1 Tax=Caerostris extrusa TaxID=172846 RepID=A0AAV4SMV3_CAEEX|nr:PACT_coil_coil domain-containing protein [Caerostris extrusa]
MDDERRKKIEAGRQKFAKFKKKRLKNETKMLRRILYLPQQLETLTCKIMMKHLFQSSSSIESLTMKAESSASSNNEMNTNLAMENFLQLSEGSDDAVHLVKADSKLVSLYDEKIKHYQSAIHRKDSLIQTLSERLASVMKVHNANSGNEEVKNLQEEISLLHQQMKEAAEMLQKQKSVMECRVESVSIEEAKELCEVSVQVEASLDALEELLYIILRLLNSLNVNNGCGDGNLPRFNVLDQQPNAYLSDMSSLLKKLETLSAVTQLVESLVNISSTRTSIEGAGDFHVANFRAIFLKAIEFGEAEMLEPDISKMKVSYPT